MLILSWNVAGLATTMNRIHEAYKPGKEEGTADVETTSLSSTVAKKQKKPSHPAAAMAVFLQRHGADIFCVQEHKIPRQQLTNRAEPRQLSTVPGYESFWSCCVDTNKKGFNGVVTYARQGTVRRACANPLGSPDLDNQGRCVMTDHGSFCLFNVYVPASGGQPLSYKMKFLNALRTAMKRQRQEAGKPVILVGDLNISHTKKDIFWKDRSVYIDKILREVEESMSRGSSGDNLPKWKLEISKHWAFIQSVLEKKEVIPTKTTNSLTNETYSKYRLCVTVNDRRVYLGKHETSPEYCLYFYDFAEQIYVDEESGETILAQEGNVVRIEILTELMAKIANVQWSEETQRLISNTDATVRDSPPRQWLTSVLQEDGMVDVFRHFYPTAEARFTCWNQFTNRRYANDGARIDYTLVDSCLLEYVRQGVDSLRCCGSSEEEDHLSEAAALRAVTANGLFQPVSFQGGGIQEATQTALDTQFGPPHSGMIYTPPSFSDHIATSLLMDDSILPIDLLLDEKDSDTRKTQPHKVQKSIASFFGKASSSDSMSTNSNGSKKSRQTGGTLFRKQTTQSKKLALGKKTAAKKSTILDHFQPLRKSAKK
jgi:exodeoxyribonuclease III